MRSVYLASSYKHKGAMRLHAEELKNYGIKITSRWLDEQFSENVKLTDSGMPNWEPYAVVDLEDIKDADTMIFFAEDPDNQPPRGGRHVEFGYAIAQGLDIIVVGPFENLFHHLKGIKHYDSFVDLLRGEFA